MATDYFCQAVYKAVRLIPDGYVTTYGQIAEYIGCRGAARAVGNALHKNPNFDITPCYKVVSSKGLLAPNFAFGGIAGQKKLLSASGVEVVNNKVDLSKYLYKFKF